MKSEPGTSPHICGDLRQWPSKDQMASILTKAGFRVTVGKYSIRIEDYSYFVFQQYGGDLGEPCIDADADSPAEMLREAEQVSTAFSHAGMAHRLEVYDSQNSLIGYFHHDWPQTDV